MPGDLGGEVFNAGALGEADSLGFARVLGKAEAEAPGGTPGVTGGTPVLPVRSFASLSKS